MNLFSPSDVSMKLLASYEPKRPKYFQVDKIFLARGSDTSEGRLKLIQKICDLYPEAEKIECLDVPHNRIDLQEEDPLEKNIKGKRSLVFGEHKSSIRFSAEEGNACPNYWHFSPYGYCFYGCKYCYLSGTKTYWHSPSVRIFLNLEEILLEIDRCANKGRRPIAFYLGKLQDGLALDPLTGYSQILVPFFSRHEYARQIILTKTDEVDQLLELDHGGHTILSWSVNPPEISSYFEKNVPLVKDRIRAMQRCAEKGYTVRAVMMPIIPLPGWQDYYAGFTQELLREVPLSRLTLGGICIYKNARKLMELTLGKRNEISNHIDEGADLSDGRARYPVELRMKLYSHIIELARKARPDLEIALCLEEAQVWETLGLKDSIGRCNCVL